MKIFSVLFLFLALPLFGLAQETLYEDNFDKDLGQWTLSGNFLQPVFNDGKMILKGSSEEDMAIVQTQVVIDPDKDFFISCTCSYNGGSFENAFGVILSDETHSDDPRNFFYMLIPGDGYEIDYANSTQYNLRFYPYFPRVKDRTLAKEEGTTIEFLFRNTGGTWDYYINGQKAWSKANPGICISSIGFFSMGLREFKVDHMVVGQDGWRDIKLADDSQVHFEKENLGPNINTAAAELLPIISADGQTLYLCVQDEKANTGGANDQDIWYSELQPDGTWSKRENIGFPLNNTSSNFVNYVSPDNNTLWVGNQYDASGKLAGDGLSVSYRTEKGWSIPEPLMISKYYNSNRFISVTNSPSGKVLIMSIERADSYGCKDLYVSFKKDDGTWSEPVNMGRDINTFGDEISPFLAADNSTLYFATYARPGYGNYDIFITRRLDDTWTKWSEPKNMGPNINTGGGDAYFTIPVVGEYSYLVSSKNTFGGADIFRVKVSEVARPNRVALINGRVYDQETKNGIEAEITYYDLETNEEIGTARSDPEDGNYQIALPSGHKYSYFARKDGYFSVRENIDLTEITEYSEVKKDLVLVPVKVGGVILLNNIFFEFDKSDLLPASFFELEDIVMKMNEYPNMVIRIEGHTDNVGSDEYNQKLSEDRARAVFTYLRSKNLGDRVSSIGYGESRPIATNETDEGRAQNRRVEFVILSI
jgi:outer membrane protein OmpA-like peptidoglycan-associated protein